MLLEAANIPGWRAQERNYWMQLGWEKLENHDSVDCAFGVRERGIEPSLVATVWIA